LFIQKERALIRYLGKTNCLLLLSSFITVSALLPTLAMAASISGFVFLKRLHQYRSSSLLETSMQFRAPFTEEFVSMTQ
jgi:hypothetical protein